MNCRVIMNNENKVVEEFKETRRGQFPFWNEDALERAKNRLTELLSA